jgi:hypothetical protein
MEPLHRYTRQARAHQALSSPALSGCSVMVRIVRRDHFGTTCRSSHRFLAKSSDLFCQVRAYFLVAGTGFEPMTSGL